MAIFLNNEDVEAIFTMDVCLEVLEEAFKELAKGDALNVARTEAALPKDDPETVYRLKLMAGAVPKMGVMALRINSDIASYPTMHGFKRQIRKPPPRGRVNFMIVFSLDTSEVLAVLPDNYFSKMRVGGSTGLGAKCLARKDARSVGLYGSGWQATAQLEAVCAVRKIEKAKVYSLNPDHRKRFALEMSKKLEREVVPVDEPREAMRNVDIVVGATSSLDPVIKGAWLEEGMHLVTILWPEVDDDAYLKSDVVVVNTKPLGQAMGKHDLEDDLVEYTMKSRPDVPFIFKGQRRPFNWDKAVELGDLLLGKHPGRRNDGEITFHVNNIGLGIQFAAGGAKIYKLAKAKGLGKEVPSEMLDWFYKNQQMI